MRSSTGVVLGAVWPACSLCKFDFLHRFRRARACEDKLDVELRGAANNTALQPRARCIIHVIITCL